MMWGNRPNYDVMQTSRDVLCDDVMLPKKKICDDVMQPKEKLCDDVMQQKKNVLM